LPKWQFIALEHSKFDIVSIANSSVVFGVPFKETNSVLRKDEQPSTEERGF